MTRVDMIAGMAQAWADKQRHERLARQPDAVHQAIHDERRAGHVAGVFQQRQHEEQQADLRQEHQHAADAADQPVGDEAVEIARRQPAAQRAAGQRRTGRR